MTKDFWVFMGVIFYTAWMFGWLGFRIGWDMGFSDKNDIKCGQFN